MLTVWIKSNIRQVNKINKRNVGKIEEEKAATYLCGLGYKILSRNFYSHFGEIDIIAFDGEYLVFIEVKYRKDNSCGDPIEAVTPVKIKRMTRTAQYYCYTNGISFDIPMRFDVIGIKDDDIVHYKNVTGF